MALWMNLGTINVVNGSKAVTGVGTKFKTAPIPAREGQPIVINNVHYEIGSVNSDTSITLALNYAGATANSLPYTIITTAEGSFNDLSRRAAQVMSLYQGYMDVYDALFSGTGNVTVTLPDGDVVTLPAWNTMQPKDSTLTSLSGKPVKTFGMARLNDQDAAATRVALALGSAAQRAAQGNGDLLSVDSVVGLVAQVDGVNTGAIVEVGENANGMYIKYAGGLMVAIVTVSISSYAVNTAAGSIFQSGVILTANYPVTFVRAVRSFLEVRYDGGGARPWAAMTSQGVSSSAYVLQSPLSMSAFSGALHVGVIGFWY